ncbi:unknown [Ruminococcus sp. CAG:579]|nr:unknown [Ruminococcus sp. CAG:579]
MCEWPILVITATVGSQHIESREISPKCDIPISMTAACVSLLRLKSVSGRPISLLWLPSVFKVLYFLETTSAIISFVVVLPTLPVMPTSGISNLRL